MPLSRSVCSISAMDGHPPPMLEINGLGRLISTFPLSPSGVGEIDSNVAGIFAFFYVSRFSFVFDGFVFQFAECTIFCVAIGGNFVFFGSLSRCEFGSVGRPFYAIYGDFERNLFAHYFLLVL